MNLSGEKWWEKNDEESQKEEDVMGETGMSVMMALDLTNRSIDRSMLQPIQI